VANQPLPRCDWDRYPTNKDFDLMTDTGWYFSIEAGKSCGPISLSKIRSAISSGKIQPIHLVWHESLGDWHRVESVPILTLVTPVSVTPPPIQYEGPPPFVTIDGRKASTSKNRSNRETLISKIIRDRVVSIVSFAFIAAIALIPVAVLASQYFPFTGGFMAGIAVPWSPARRSGIPSHILVLSCVGLFFGGVTGELIHRSKTAAIICVIGCIALFSAAFLMCLLFAQQPTFPRGF